MRTIAGAGGLVFAVVWMLLVAITGELRGSDAIIAISGGIGFTIAAFIFASLRE